MPKGVEFMNDKINVELISTMNASDKQITDFASICYGKEEAKNVANLINTLVKNGHTSVFEHAVFTFKITLPIFAARQLIRHRIASYTERSSRYTLPLGFYHDELLEKLEPEFTERIKDVEIFATDIYTELQARGVKKEVARTILPQTQLTELYITINVRSLFNFLTLRTSKHAQKEIREVALLMAKYLKEFMPLSYSAWEKYLADKTFKK